MSGFITFQVDEDNKMLVLYQKATSDTNIPRDDRIHRVDTYISKLIIKPHGSDFDEVAIYFYDTVISLELITKRLFLLNVSNKYLSRVNIQTKDCSKEWKSSLTDLIV